MRREKSLVYFLDSDVSVVENHWIYGAKGVLNLGLFAIQPLSRACLQQCTFEMKAMWRLPNTHA